jgi:preprotein translocase SecE subunit
MRAKGTWVLLFFVISSAIVAAALNFGLRDIFSWLQINNATIIGENLRLSLVIGVAIAAVLGIFFGIFFTPSRRYVDQCVVEFEKVAWPEWKETKKATFTVVIVSLIASVILGVFDSVFQWWTSNNLFIW